MNDIKDEPESKSLRRRVVLKVCLHSRREDACNAYMIASKFGAICGGNIRTFVDRDEMIRQKLHYPTLFKSRVSAEAHLLNDSTYVKNIENSCYNKAKLAQMERSRVAV